MAEDKNYLALALEAKRKKDFKTAQKNYDLLFQEEGLSVEILRSIGRLAYLEGKQMNAILYYLAASHLLLCEYIDKHENEDASVQQLLDRVPRAIVDQFPYTIGGLLATEPKLLIDLAHAAFDREDVYENHPELKPLSEIYYANILGDGSLMDTLKKEGLTVEQYNERNDELYYEAGIRYAAKFIKWDEIKNPNIFEIYLNQ